MAEPGKAIARQILAQHPSDPRPCLLRTDRRVLPVAREASIPENFQKDWAYFATVNIGDKLLAASSGKIAADIELHGYSVVEPTG